jgi:alanine transaminase
MMYIGAYTHSKGLQAVREEVSAFIERRDGYPCDPEDIFLSDGTFTLVCTLVGPCDHCVCQR